MRRTSDYLHYTKALFCYLVYVACFKFEQNHRCTTHRFLFPPRSLHGLHTSIWFLCLYNSIPLMCVRHNPSRPMHHLPLCFPWCPLTRWAVFPSSHPHSASLPLCHLWEGRGGGKRSKDDIINSILWIFGPLARSVGRAPARSVGRAPSNRL